MVVCYLMRAMQRFLGILVAAGLILIIRWLYWLSAAAKVSASAMPS